jgi:hypothetical protein
LHRIEGLGGVAEQTGEKLIEGVKSTPLALKRERILTT